MMFAFGFELLYSDIEWSSYKLAHFRIFIFTPGIESREYGFTVVTIEKKWHFVHLSNRLSPFAVACVQFYFLLGLL